MKVGLIRSALLGSPRSARFIRGMGGGGPRLPL